MREPVVIILLLIQIKFNVLNEDKDISAAVVKGIAGIEIYRYKKAGAAKVDDKIIQESPLQIVLAFGDAANRKKESLSVTMRTPGDDFNMLLGFLFCEGIIHHASDIVSMRFIGNPDDETLQENILLIELACHVPFNAAERSRNFIANSACGFCGKTVSDISMQKDVFLPLKNDWVVPASHLYKLPSMLQKQQGMFNITGGAHAVALINSNYEILYKAEDVGRHNAMDKLVGKMLKQQALPLYNNLVLFSGRLSYELVQKSLMAGVPVVCAIGAPTSLAIELAEESGMTVVGFLKDDSFNVYCGQQRIIQP